jgi:isocitrate/isopropylmalate dehydrogenase
MENFTETIKFFFHIITKRFPSIFLLISVSLLTIVSYNHFSIKNLLFKGNFDISSPKFRKLNRLQHAQDNTSELRNDFKQYLNYFQFIQNFTEYQYEGKWKSTYPQLDFDNSYGNMEMMIYRAKKEELYMGKEKGSFLQNCLILDIIITDGHHSDRFVNFNITLNISDLFQNQTLLGNEYILLKKKNVMSNVSFWEIIEKRYSKGKV